MRRFITSLSVAAVSVIAIGGLVFGLLGSPTTGEDPVADAVALGQTEETDTDTSSDAAAAATGAALLPIDALLEQLRGPGDGTSLPTSQRVLLSRDPFRPVVPEPDGGGSGGDGTDGDGTDGDGTDGDGTDGDGTDGDGTDDACTGDETETVCDGVVVTVDGFSDDGSAIVTVNGTTFTVGVDDEFATSFRVLAINEPCVTLLYGDEAFSICVGAIVLK